MDRTSDHKSSSSDGVRGSVQTGNASVDPRDDSEVSFNVVQSFETCSLLQLIPAPWMWKCKVFSAEELELFSEQRSAA